MVTFVGRDEILTFNLIALKAALRMYVKHRMIANRRLSASRMLKLAGEATGKIYKRGQHEIALTDIEALIEERRKNDEGSQA